MKLVHPDKKGLWIFVVCDIRYFIASELNFFIMPCSSDNLRVMIDTNGPPQLFNLHNVHRISETQMIICHIKFHTPKLETKEDPIASKLDNVTIKHSKSSNCRMKASNGFHM